MSIEKNSDWGSAGPLRSGAYVAGTDAELRHHVEQHRRAGRKIAAAGLVGGDLWTTMGSPRGGADRLSSDTARTVPIDVASVLLDGRQFWFVSHLVARGSWWRGRVLVAMNAEWLGSWDLGPRSHPNDGHVDIYDTTMASSQRMKAWRRMRHGTHVPHPDISYSRTTAYQTTFDPPVRIWLDGEGVGNVSNLTLRVEADALEITV